MTSADDPQDLIEALRARQVKTDEQLRELRGLVAQVSNPPQVVSANVHQSPGSGLVIACAVMFGMNVMLAALVVVMGIRLFDLDDKLSAIYMLAPHLKPEEGARK